MSKPKFVAMRFVLVPDLGHLLFIEPDISDGIVKVNVGPEFSKTHPMIVTDALNKELKKLGLEEGN